MRMTLERVESVGGGKHLRLTLTRDGARITAMKFSTLPENFPYRVGETVDLAVYLDRNEYHGTVSVSIVVKDVRLTDLPQDELIEAVAQVDAVVRREPETPYAVRFPERECTARVYRFLKQQPYCGPLDVLCHRLKTQTVTCTDILVACRVLREARLIEWRDEGDTVFACVRATTEKVDLNQTATAVYLNTSREV